MIQYEYSYVPDNIVTQTARQLIARYSIPRALEEDIRDGLIKEFHHSYLQCVKCRAKGIMKKYLASEMIHISYRTKRNGTASTQYRHYCSRCAKEYKPQSQRVGGRD